MKSDSILLYLISFTQLANVDACSPGYFLETGVCVQCNPGYYCSGVDDLYHPCIPGSYSGVKGARSCTSCGFNTYTPNPKSTYCSNCPTGKLSLMGASECSTPTCNPGSYYTSGACSACPVSNYCAGGTSSPQLCPVGTYAGSTGLSACIKCAEGTYGATTGLSGCSGCQKGQYNSLTGVTVCTSCPVGAYSGVDGQSVCTTCASGVSFSNILGASACKTCSSLSCPDNSQEISSCTTTSDQTCVSCPAIPSFSGWGQTPCSWVCTPGYFVGPTNSFCCSNCLPGQYNQGCSASSPGTCTICAICQPGHYNTGCGGSNPGVCTEVCSNKQ